MKIFGFEVSRSKSAVAVTQIPPAVQSISSSRGWFGVIRESFAGAWQRNVEVDATHSLLAFSAVYACITLIAGDIAKLRIKLVQQKDGVWLETTSPAFSPVLAKPNRYQTRIQFLAYWIMCKLVHGNTYVLKERDGRGAVVAMYILNPTLVRPLITEDGSVYYSVGGDKLSGMGNVQFTVPASEMIHDRAICLFHPLIGVPPLFACGMSATQGNRIQANSAKFFENMSRPSGSLTSPDTIDDITAERLKKDFEANFSGSNLGRLLVAGDGLKYEPMTIPAQQAQLIEQLKWTVEDVARCFHVPLHKISSDVAVKFTNMGAMNQDYYSQTLQGLIEDFELLLDEGLGLPAAGYGSELDLDVLLRMDPAAIADYNERGVKGGYLKPNEARARLNLAPVAGGDTPYMQVQNYSLAKLAKQDPPGATPAPKPAADPAADPAMADPAMADPAAPASPTKAIADLVARLDERVSQAAAFEAKSAEDMGQMRGLIEQAQAEAIEADRRKAEAETAAAALAAERAQLELAKAAAEQQEADLAHDFVQAMLERFETEPVDG